MDEIMGLNKRPLVVEIGRGASGPRLGKTNGLAYLRREHPGVPDSLECIILPYGQSLAPGPFSTCGDSGATVLDLHGLDPG